MTRRILVDFSSDTLPPLILTGKRIAYRGLIVGRFEMLANEGVWIGAPHLTLTVHEGGPIELGWQPQEAQEAGHHIVSAGQFHLFPPDHFVHVHWARNRQILGIAFTQSYIERTVSEAFNGQIPELQPMAAIYDPEIGQLTERLRQIMKKDSKYNIQYINHIGALLALRLHEIHGNSSQPLSSIVSGGLGGSRQRRVMDYIEAHLGEDLNLSDLASEVGLSLHHFSRAFRATLGTSPYRYLNRRRILRAQQLLLDPQRSLTEIGLSLGFSSHSHFTDTFRKITGMTPSEFRRSRL